MLHRRGAVRARRCRRNHSHAERVARDIIRYLKIAEYALQDFRSDAKGKRV